MKLFNWENKKTFTIQVGLFLFFIGYIWFIAGWRGALIFVPLLVVHEMGHLWMMERFGIKVRGVYFTPLGAVAPAEFHSDFRSEAWIGIMGPLWGFGSAVAALALFFVFHQVFFLVAALFACYLNLFNLIPLLPMDGARVLRALTGSFSPKWSMRWFLFLSVFGALLLFKISIVMAIVVLVIGWGELRMEYERRKILVQLETNPEMKHTEEYREIAPYIEREPLFRKDKIALLLVYIGLIVFFIGIMVFLALLMSGNA